MTPTAQGMTNQIQQGNYGAAVNDGLSGLGSVIPNGVASAALTSAAGTGGLIVDALVAGD